ncbi:integral membrane protein [Colletotrichum salicis]|uniref:Integral membrane protein n=1 Tax=Colletotrichum salicis TaxID=1209931 RepID=A0A135V9F8_9PEZI|nr:integral membrane protein [Colletotrichum salicis]
MRLFVRIKILGQTHLDDHLTVASLLLSYATVALEIWAIRCGNGRHADTLSQNQQSAAILSTISGFPPNVLAYTVPKFAVVALLVRILNPGKKHQVMLWCMATGCLVLVSLCIIILFAQCTPTRAQWEFTVTEKSCWSPWILVNVAILTGDDSAELVVWTIVEGNTLIIAACIPILGPLIELALGRRVLSSTDRKYQKQSDPAVLRSGGIEMNGSRSVPRNGIVAGKTSTTIGSRIDLEDASSQDSIVRAETGPSPRVPGIMRRQDITVSYERAGEGCDQEHEDNMKSRKWDSS